MFACADLFIDTFAWNGNSTAIDSLWTGLPVVTLLGKGYAARTTASLLNTLDLNELIANSTNEYEEIVISLARNPNKLKLLKNKLLNSKYTNPLFRSKVFIKDLESQYINLVDELKIKTNNQTKLS